MELLAFIGGIGTPEFIILGGGGFVAVVVLIVVLKLLTGKKPTGGRESSVEDLSEYPPPPSPGSHRLMLEGTPVRLRLVVLAPVGKSPIDLDEADALLDKVLAGLGDVADADRPKLKVWPPQLSSQGFAPTFHRLTERPEAEGKPSRWVLVAGPASAGKRPILVGLALLADKTNTRGRMTVQINDWSALLSVRSN